jgi:hypothetical protein
MTVKVGNNAALPNLRPNSLPIRQDRRITRANMTLASSHHYHSTMKITFQSVFSENAMLPTDPSVECIGLQKLNGAALQ